MNAYQLRNSVERSIWYNVLSNYKSLTHPIEEQILKRIRGKLYENISMSIGNIFTNNTSINIEVHMQRIE